MATFYQEFKFAVECFGLTAPAPSIGDNLFMISQSLSTMAGGVLALGQRGGAMKLEDLLAYGMWAKSVWGTSPTGTVMIRAITPQAKAGVDAVRLMQCIPRAQLFLRATIYGGSVAVAGYVGILTGAAVYAFGHCDYNLGMQSSFWHWWYGGTATDRRTAEMQKILQSKHEVSNMQVVKRQMGQFIESRYQPTLA